MVRKVEKLSVHVSVHVLKILETCPCRPTTQASKYSCHGCHVFNAAAASPGKPKDGYSASASHAWSSFFAHDRAVTHGAAGAAPKPWQSPHGSHGSPQWVAVATESAAAAAAAAAGFCKCYGGCTKMLMFNAPWRSLELPIGC